AQTKFHRDHAAGHVADQHRNRERRVPRWAFSRQNGELLFERFEAADAAADDRAEAVAIYFFQIEPAVLDRHLGRSHCELNESVGPAHVLWILENRFRIEIANFARDFAIVLRDVEGGDSADTAFAFLQRAPKCFEIIADRRDDTHSCNDDAAIVIHKSDG